MSIYRDALYWYSKHIRTKNYRLLKNVAEFTWRHTQINEKIDAAITYDVVSSAKLAKQTREVDQINKSNTNVNIVSHCLVCCKIDTLHPCRVCNIVHTCYDCLHSCECFMQNKITQLRLRTLKYSLNDLPMQVLKNVSKIPVYELAKLIQKKDMKTVIEFYNDTFPINDYVIEISERKIKQGKCRNELKLWANHLFLPISALAKVLIIREDVFFVFGTYERGKEINSCYQECNFYNSQFLIDEHNFERLKQLPYQELQNQYAKQAFSLTRKLNRGVIDCAYSMYPHCYSPLKYSKRLNFVYTVSLRSSDHLSVKCNSKWNELYSEYRKLINEKKTKSNADKKKELLQARSAIVFKYVESSMYSTLLWDKAVNDMNHKVLFCFHWFVDPVEPHDPICRYSKLSGSKTAIIHPSVHNMLYELNSLMKSAFSPGIYALNGKYSCVEVMEEKERMLKEQLYSKSILYDGSNFEKFICTDKILISDYSPKVLEIVNELNLSIIPITNLYTYRTQSLVIAGKKNISMLIHLVAKNILVTMLAGDFKNSHTTNLYTRTDRYVAYAFEESEDSMSDVD
mgnify:CR=1 FL=1|uniref:NSP1 n=1 Tax=Rotavirus A TaxID=28875 RepID=A0A1B1LZB3_9REOV|nr:NSP1 [Rotavirus A]